MLWIRVIKSGCITLGQFSLFLFQRQYGYILIEWDFLVRGKYCLTGQNFNYKSYNFSKDLK